MLEFFQFSSISLIDRNLHHYDDSTFPDDLYWFSLLEKHVFQEKHDIQIYVIADSVTGVRVALPMLRRVRAEGCELLALQNYYTADYRPICSSVEARELIAPLLREILRSERAVKIRLTPVDDQSSGVAAMVRELSIQGWHIARASASINWTCDVSGSYEHYLAQLSSRVQNTLKRKARQLNSLSEVQIAVHTGETGLPELLDSYAVIYEKSWKSSEPYEKFIPALIERMAEQKSLRLGLIRVGGEPVAVHFWIVKGGCAYIFKLAHDPDYNQYSPGTVLMSEMLRHVIDIDQVKKLDFMTGDDQYKQDWMNCRREKYALSAYNLRSMSGFCAFIVECRAKPALSAFKRFILP